MLVDLADFFPSVWGYGQVPLSGLLDCTAIPDLGTNLVESSALLMGSMGLYSWWSVLNTFLWGGKLRSLQVHYPPPPPDLHGDHGRLLACMLDHCCCPHLGGR